MVSADYSSSCSNGTSEDDLKMAGEPCGFVIDFGEDKVYHSGDTNATYDMFNIDYLYTPTHVIIPIDSIHIMGPREAAYALCKFFKHASIVIPMRYSNASVNGSFE